MTAPTWAAERAREIVAAEINAPLCKHDDGLVPICDICIVERIAAALVEQETESIARCIGRIEQARAEGREAGLEEAIRLVETITCAEGDQLSLVETLSPMLRALKAKTVPATMAESGQSDGGGE